MDMQKKSASFYIFFGCLLLLFFGGFWIFKLIGVIVGLLMIRHGLGIMSGTTTFQIFSFFSQDRYR